MFINNSKYCTDKKQGVIQYFFSIETFNKKKMLTSICPQLIRLINRNSLSKVHLVSLLYKKKRKIKGINNSLITHKNTHKIRSTWHNFCLVHKIQYGILSNPIHSSISLFYIYIILTHKWKKTQQVQKKALI